MSLAGVSVRQHRHLRPGQQPILGSPIALSETPPTFRSPAPWLGQHSDDALRELGLDDTEIARLYADGVVYNQRRAKEGDR